MTTGRINQVTARTRGPATRTRAPPKEGSARARAGLVAASDLLDLSIFLRTGSGGRSPFRPTPFFVISSRPVRAYGTSPFIIVITLCVCVTRESFAPASVTSCLFFSSVDAQDATPSLFTAEPSVFARSGVSQTQSIDSGEPALGRSARDLAFDPRART